MVSDGVGLLNLYFVPFEVTRPAQNDPHPLGGGGGGGGGGYKATQYELAYDACGAEHQAAALYLVAEAAALICCNSPLSRVQSLDGQLLGNVLVFGEELSYRVLQTGQSP